MMIFHTFTVLTVLTVLIQVLVKLLNNSSTLNTLKALKMLKIKCASGFSRDPLKAPNLTYFNHLEFTRQATLNKIISCEPHQAVYGRPVRVVPTVQFPLSKVNESGHFPVSLTNFWYLSVHSLVTLPIFLTQAKCLLLLNSA